jgi:hypothetical protein
MDVKNFSESDFAGRRRILTSLLSRMCKIVELELEKRPWEGFPRLDNVMAVIALPTTLPLRIRDHRARLLFMCFIVSCAK